MSVHVFLQFVPLAGNGAEFREELLRVNQPSRAEPGCLGIYVFESLREPVTFAIHSEWVDESAFELHAELPHTLRFLAIAERLMGRPVQGLRTVQIGGGPGAGATPTREYREPTKL